MKRLTVTQQAALIKLGKQRGNIAIIPVVTADALVRVGYVTRIRMGPFTLRRGTAVELTDKGREWLKS